MAGSSSTSWGMHEPDPKAIVWEYIRSLGLDPHATGYKLFNLRAQATAKEVAIMARHHSLALHPDKKMLDQWLMNKGNFSQSFISTAKNELASFYSHFLQEREKLVDFDEKLHKQARCCTYGDIALPSAVCTHTYNAEYGNETKCAHSNYRCNLLMLNVYLVAGLHRQG
jgi:virulence-associated protein VagC